MKMIQLFMICVLCITTSLFSIDEKKQINNEQELIECINLLPNDQSLFDPIYLFLRNKAYLIEKPEKIRSLLKGQLHRYKNSMNIVESQSFIAVGANLSWFIFLLGVCISSLARIDCDKDNVDIAVGLSLVSGGMALALKLVYLIQNGYFILSIEKYDKLLDAF